LWGGVRAARECLNFEDNTETSDIIPGPHR
jgi:hypothetical protein